MLFEQFEESLAVHNLVGRLEDVGAVVVGLNLGVVPQSLGGEPQLGLVAHVRLVRLVQDLLQVQGVVHALEEFSVHWVIGMTQVTC